MADEGTTYTPAAFLRPRGEVVLEGVGQFDVPIEYGVDLMLEVTPEFFGVWIATEGQAMVLEVPSVHAVGAPRPGSR